MPSSSLSHAQPFASHGVKSLLPVLLARLCILASAVDVAYFIFFHIVGSTFLAWINVLSIALYASAFVALRQRSIRLAAFLIWLEAFSHATVGTMMLGWGSGFHYLLLMFVPGIAMSSHRRQIVAFILSMIAFLVALRVVSYYFGAIAPIPSDALELLEMGNFILFVLMFSWSADFYRAKLVRAEKQLQLLATTDNLTSLFNRRHFLELAERSQKQTQRSGGMTCIAILDIDHFKIINDKFGHEAGDKVLVTVSQLLKSRIRGADILARWGGEEFVLLMPSTELDGACELLEQVREMIQQAATEVATNSIRVTISIGVASFGETTPLSDAFGRADVALYQSKENGRNRVTQAAA